MITKFQLKDFLLKDFSQRMKKYSSDLSKGEFTDDYKGMSILLSMKSLDLPIGGEEVATFILSQFIVGINTHENIFTPTENEYMGIPFDL